MKLKKLYIISITFTSMVFCLRAEHPVLDLEPQICPDVTSPQFCLDMTNTQYKACVQQKSEDHPDCEDIKKAYNVCMEVEPDRCSKTAALCTDSWWNIFNCLGAAWCVYRAFNDCTATKENEHKCRARLSDVKALCHQVQNDRMALLCFTYVAMAGGKEAPGAYEMLLEPCKEVTPENYEQYLQKEGEGSKDFKERAERILTNTANAFPKCESKCSTESDETKKRCAAQCFYNKVTCAQKALYLERKERHRREGRA